MLREQPVPKRTFSHVISALEASLPHLSRQSFLEPLARLLILYTKQEGRKEEKKASLDPGTGCGSEGCSVPRLTRLAPLPCGKARRRSL